MVRNIQRVEIDRKRPGKETDRGKRQKTKDGEGGTVEERQRGRDGVQEEGRNKGGETKGKRQRGT